MTRYTLKTALFTFIAFALATGDGLAVDGADGKITALYFSKPGCSYCRKFDSGTLKDPAVMKEASTLDWVRVKTNSDEPIDHLGARVSQRQLTIKHGVNLTPTVVFVAPDGRVLAAIRGFFETPDFLEMMKYVTEGHYKNETFEAYIARKARGE